MSKLENTYIYLKVIGINLAHFLNFHWNCKMMGCSKMTETLQKDVVQMKAEVMTLSAIARSVISKILQLYNINKFI